MVQEPSDVCNNIVFFCLKYSTAKHFFGWFKKNGGFYFGSVVFQVNCAKIIKVLLTYEAIFLRIYYNTVGGNMVEAKM